MKVGINGFGRIGKHIYKILLEHKIEVPLINDPFISLDYLAYLIKYDTVYGKLKCYIEDDSVVCQDFKTKLTNYCKPNEIPWIEHGIEYVIEASGVFKTLDECDKHNAKRVILTAPSTDIPMFVYGVNHESINNEKVISAASCTTNCVTPLIKVLDDNFGIEEGLMSTVHAMTATQSVTDSKGNKWRSSRSCCNIIPATTGAAEAVTKIIPSLQGKINGMAFRVPIINVSLVDLTVRLRRPANMSLIQSAIDKYEFPRVLAYTEDETVSSDFIGDSRSSILDLKASMELNENFFKLVSWYDNEHGYSSRVVDIIKHVADN